MSDVRLNLARKWRAKVFDQIIGQDLTVRILKNSLYLGNYFPVYLFLGQRGSGKTSTARVFAAALNCERLEEFRKNPKNYRFPCGECTSCKAMMAGKHPDFIEMDAASHTGVDNVRQIIDAASLMPLLGCKKIYLIDEAHMLSKAAFNAFLKILEEPPASVLFILATTDPEKIIETVKSRCFQLFFKPVSASPLQNHLEHICKDEEITYEPDALSLIVKETSGSVRDALNMLEQVRFAAGSVSKSGLIQVLGHIDDERLFKLFEIVLYHNTTTLLPFLQDLNIRDFSVEHVWNRLIQLIRSSIWLKHDINPEQYHEQIDSLRVVIQKTSLKKLTELLQHFYNQELLFLKTTDKHLFLEILLLQACQRNDTPPNSNMSPASPLPPLSQENDEDVEYIEIIEEEEEDEEDEEEAKKGNGLAQSTAGSLWDDFLTSVESLEDPLLSSIFKQGKFEGFDSDTHTVTVSFSKEFKFFNEWLENARNLWLPLLQKVCGSDVIFNPLFILQGAVVNNVSKPIQKKTESSNNVVTNGNGLASSFTNTPAVAQPICAQRGRFSPQHTQARRKIIDVSDTQRWQKSNLLLRHFSGVISEY